jgi:hypothetical protein
MIELTRRSSFLYKISINPTRSLRGSPALKTGQTRARLPCLRARPHRAALFYYRPGPGGPIIKWVMVFADLGKTSPVNGRTSPVKVMTLAGARHHAGHREGQLRCR